MFLGRVTREGTCEKGGEEKKEGQSERACAVAASARAAAARVALGVALADDERAAVRLGHAAGARGGAVVCEEQLGELEEELRHALAELGGRREVLRADRLGVRLGLLERHHTLPLEIALVARDDQHDPLAQHLSQLLHPVLHPVKRVPVRDVVHQNRTCFRRVFVRVRCPEKKKKRLL